MGYRGYGLPLSELISEGNVGMMQAVKRFEPERGFRLATYAMWWIRAAIQEYVLHSWSLVKMGTTAAQKKLRSEEHTSELQSLMRNSYAVFCLKKNTHPKQILSSRVTTPSHIPNQKDNNTHPSPL